MTIRLRFLASILIAGSITRVFAEPAQGIESVDPIERLSGIVDHMDDYQVRVVSWVRNEDQTERWIVNLYFKRPDLLRVDVLEGSQYGETGTITLLHGDTVAVRAGLKFVPFTLSFDKHNPRVTSIRGRTIDAVHIPQMLDDMEQGLEEGIARIRYSGGRYIYEADYTAEANAMVERLYFDEETFLPLHNETYENGELVEYVTWTHYLFDQDIPEWIFSTATNSNDIAKLPMLTLAAWKLSRAERALADPGPPWDPPP